MRGTPLPEVALALSLSICGMGPLAAPLGDDYAQLEDAMRSLEAQREGHEQRLDEQIARWHQRKASWDDCVEKIQYPQRVCWEGPRIEAQEREQTLTEQRRILEALRGELESERKTLEGRRRGLEARFVNKGPGSAYESEFRGYMRDVSDYLDRVKGRLNPGYDDYVAKVGGYVEFLDQQAQACPAARHCELAERYGELDAQRALVQQQRRGFEQRLTKTVNPEAPVPAMFAAAEILWGKYLQQPRDAETVQAVEAARQMMEQERSRLEEQRRNLEKRRAALESTRVELEKRREQLEAGQSGKRRGGDYQAEFIKIYIDPMLTNIDSEKQLFANYQTYEDAILLYVYFIRTTVEEDPDMRAVASTMFERYSDEMQRTQTLVDNQRRARTEALTSKQPPADSQVVPASVTTSAQAPVDAAAKAGVARTIAGLMRDYVDSIQTWLSRAG